MQILLQADTETSLGLKEVKWKVWSMKDIGGGCRIGQESQTANVYLILSQPNKELQSKYCP